MSLTSAISHSAFSLRNLALHIVRSAVASWFVRSAPVRALAGDIALCPLDFHSASLHSGV